VLVYNLFIFTVAFLLYLDYLVHTHDVYITNGGTRLSLGNTFMYLALFVIVFFAGFRFEIGYDYDKYKAGYFFESELKHWEPFFNFIVRTIRKNNLGLGIQALFLFFSAATVMVIYRALRALTPHYRMGLLLYFLIKNHRMNSLLAMVGAYEHEDQCHQELQSNPLLQSLYHMIYLILGFLRF